MTKPGGSLTTKKPTYKNVHWKPLDDPDKFRDADRIEEAQKIPLTEAQQILQEENKELKEDQHTEQDDPTLFDLVKANPNLTYREAEKLQEKQRLKKEAGTCIMGEARKDREELDWYPDGFTFQEKYEKERKLRQEAEGETTIVKAIGQNSPEMKALRKEVEELKADLARAREDHQFDNMVHQKELAKMGK